MPRVPCLDNLTVSREYNGRIFGNVTRNAFGKLTAGRLWIVVVARPNSSIDEPICGPLFIQRFIQFCISLARFFSTPSDCLNVSQSLFTTPPSLVGQTNYPMFTSSRHSGIFSSRTSLFLAFLFWFEMNYSTLFVISSRHSGIFSGCISLLFAFLFWFETNYSMFHYFSSYILRLYSTFRLFILSSLVKMELFDVYFSRYRKIF